MAGRGSRGADRAYFGSDRTFSHRRGDRFSGGAHSPGRSPIRCGEPRPGPTPAGVRRTGSSRQPSPYRRHRRTATLGRPLCRTCDAGRKPVGVARKRCAGSGRIRAAAAASQTGRPGRSSRRGDRRAKVDRSRNRRRRTGAGQGAANSQPTDRYFDALGVGWAEARSRQNALIGRGRRMARSDRRHSQFMCPGVRTRTLSWGTSSSVTSGPSRPRTSPRNARLTAPCEATTRSRSTSPNQLPIRPVSRR